MARGLRSITKILTDYRAIAHLVEAIVILMFMLIQWLFGEFDLMHLIPIAYAVFEGLKGCLLLRGIIKEHTLKVKVYNILSAISIIVKMILYIVWATYVLNNVYRIFVRTLVYLLGIAIIYFGYEWYLFYHVTQFYYYLRSNQEERNVKHPINGEIV